MLLEVNKAIFDKLVACSGCQVFDSVPENKKKPYVVLAEVESTPWDSKTTKGFEVSAGVLIYSDYKGDKEINNITERIRAALTDTDYDLGPSLKVITQSLDLVKVERVEEYRQGTINIKLKIYKKDSA